MLECTSCFKTSCKECEEMIECGDCGDMICEDCVVERECCDRIVCGECVPYYQCNGEYCSKAHCKDCDSESNDVDCCTTCCYEFCGSCRYLDCATDWKRACCDCKEMIAPIITSRLIEDNQKLREENEKLRHENETLRKG